MLKKLNICLLSAALAAFLMPEASAQDKLAEDISLLGREASFEPGLHRVIDFVTGNIVYVFVSRTNREIIMEVVDYPQKENFPAYKRKLESKANDRRQ